jgi:hypothetical protein
VRRVPDHGAVEPPTFEIINVCDERRWGNATAMYIGIGTIVLILLIVLAIWLIRGRTVV